jgi:methyltransferase (TIGR00027 family)
MKQKQSSTTAQGMALVRAIEAARPEAVRICNDPIARALVPTFAYTLSKWFIDSGLYAKMSRGAIEFITARERYIDDFLSACLGEGIEQVVLLGAGFDTRAYRIPGIEKTRVFEIDHPTTQAQKIKRLKKVFRTLPARVAYLGVDLNTQTLEEAFHGSGYSEQAQTLFIWQGVTVYLTQAGVDNTLAFLAQHAAPGSAVIFDYFYRETLDDTSRPEVKSMLRAAKVTGEKYLFGIGKGKLEEFLTQRGFTDVHNADSEDLKRLYFHGANAERPIASGAAVAWARVG